MSDELLRDAYKTGRDEYRKARLNTSIQLQKSFPEEESDTVLAASQMGMELYEIAFDLCRKINQGAHTVEAAQYLIRKKCPGFSEEVYHQAFSDALIENR